MTNTNERTRVRGERAKRAKSEAVVTLDADQQAVDVPCRREEIMSGSYGRFTRVAFTGRAPYNEAWLLMVTKPRSSDLHCARGAA